MMRSPLLITLFVTHPLVAAAQEVPLELTRLAGPITLDGGLTSRREQVPALPLTMYTPVFRGTPTQRTEIRVAYDDEYFYAAGWFYDTDPSASASTRCTATAGTATTRSRSTSTRSTTTRTRSGSASRAGGHALRPARLRRRRDAQREAGTRSGRRATTVTEGRLVRRGANSVLEHRLSAPTPRARP